MSNERPDTPVAPLAPGRSRRRAFVPPRVEDLGGLSLLTLQSAGGEGLRQAPPPELH
jgi:hypothetical protein